MDIFKSSYIYIYMRGIASAQGMLSTGAQGSWEGTEAWRGLVQGTELGLQAAAAWAMLGCCDTAPSCVRVGPSLGEHQNLISLVLKQFVMAYLKNKSG